jgi:hypothetical protein
MGQRALGFAQKTTKGEEGLTTKLNLRIKLLKHKAKLLQQTKKQNFKILVDKAFIKKLV